LGHTKIFRKQKEKNKKSNMFKLKNKKGMTLIEVVVVIAIIGIMAAVSIVSLSKTRNQASVEGEAEKLISVIREAQNYAINGNQTSDKCYQYSVSTNGPNFYKLKNGSDASCTMESIFELANGVEFLGSISVSFNAPHADKSTPGVTSFVLKKGSFECTIGVNQTGLITKSCL
jgi:prepilin-type N-terminal cleavage/methylation domain-containing protein